MASTRDIRRRIRSVGSTAQITKAMQMVAASKMRKAQEAALAGRPFVQLIYRFQREATTQLGEFNHPLLEVRLIRKRAVILVAAEKGYVARSTAICSAWPLSLIRSPLFSSQPGVKPHSSLLPLAGNLLPSSHTATRPIS